MSDIVIEPLCESDVGELITVQRAAFLRDVQLYGDPFLPSVTQTAEQLRADLVAPDHVFLVAKYRGRLVGSVRGIRRERTLYISRLFTAPDMEGRGIGSALLRAIEGAAVATVELFVLTTGTKSDRNIAMYVRHGYEISERTADASGIAVVRMRKVVNASHGTL